MKKILLFLFIIPIIGFGQNPNYSEHVAPIIYNKCLTCHHNGGISPLTLETYANAVSNVNNIISKALVGMQISNQNSIDEAILALDNSFNKGQIGANAMLGASMACLRAAAGKEEIWKHLSNGETSLPVPMMNILNGGAHANSNVDVQEFMIVPHGFDSFPEALRAGVEIYHSLRAVLSDEGLLGGVGDEGGFPGQVCGGAQGGRAW